MLVLPLYDRHDRPGFDCGDDDLNRWFVQVARQHKEKGLDLVAVTDEASAEVLGFYAISLAELVNADLPAKYRKRLPGGACFAWAGWQPPTGIKESGSASFMLFDAIDRVTRIAQEVGGVGLVVNAKPSAAGFYQQYSFEQMADHPLNLLLPI